MCVCVFVCLIHLSLLQLLGVLAQDGVLRWMDMESHTLLTQTGSHDLPLSHAHTSSDGQYLSAVSERGTILLYDVSVIVRKLNQVKQSLLTVYIGTMNMDSWYVCT